MSAQRVAVTTGAPATAAAFSPTLPSHAAGDRLLLVVTGKYNTTSIPTIDQGWTLVGSGTGGTGSAANDTGQTFWAAYAKDATSAAETAPTVTPGGTAPNSWEWVAVSHRHAAGEAWRDAITTSAPWVQSASDTNTASPLTGTAGAWTGAQPTAGDAIFAVGVIPTDLGTALGGTTLTCTGLTGGTVGTSTTRYVENALGQDSAAVWGGWVDFTGTATAGLAMSFTITGATNLSGSLVAISLRATPGGGGGGPAALVATSRSGAADTLSSSNSCPVPAGAAGGMTALLAIEVNIDPSNTPITATWPAGFTQIVDRQATPSGGVQLLVAKKSLTGVDVGSYATTLSASRWNQSMCALVSNATTISTPDANSLKDGSGTAIDSLSLTAAAAPVLIHFQANNSAASHTPPTGFTEQQEGDYLTVATNVPGTAGAHTASGATQSVSTPWAAVLIAAAGDAGTGTPQGSGAGAVAVSGTAIGRTVKRGSGAGSVAASGTAAGRAVKRGSGTGAVAVSGSAQGTTPVVGPKSGSGSGSVVASGTAVGRTTKRGSGAGAVTVSGSAQGRRSQRGVGTGAVVVSGAAAGQAAKRGSGSGSVTVSGSAQGSAPGIGPRSGSGSGSVAVSGSATGSTARSGSGAGAVAVEGSGSGRVIASGSGSGTVLVTGFASAAVIGTPATHPGISVVRRDGRTRPARSGGGAQARTYAGRVRVNDHDGTAEP